MADVSSLPPLQGIHHLKLAVTDLDRSLHFYEASLGAKRIPQADHKRESDGSLYAYILDVPNLGSKSWNCASILSKPRNIATSIPSPLP